MQGHSLLHALTDPTRAVLLQRLRGGERTVSDLVEASGAEQSNVSHHLRGLREMGMVAVRRQGRNRLYRIAHPQIEQVLDVLDGAGQDLERVTFYTRLEMPFDPAFHGYG